jgi:hypothetical protein
VEEVVSAMVDKDFAADILPASEDGGDSADASEEASLEPSAETTEAAEATADEPAAESAPEATSGETDTSAAKETIAVQEAFRQPQPDHTLDQQVCEGMAGRCAPRTPRRRCAMQSIQRRSGINHR